MARANHQDTKEGASNSTESVDKDTGDPNANEDENLSNSVLERTGFVSDCANHALNDSVVQCEPVLAENRDAAEENTSAILESVEKGIEIKEKKEKAPDGGWGWFIVAGCILLRCVVGGIVRSRGIIFVKLQDRFHGSATSTALITSLTGFVRLAVGPFVSVLTNRFSCRSLTTTGAVIFTIGLIISAYSPNQTFMYFSYGALCGLGRGFILTPIPILLGYYFDKRRSLAFGVASSGFSIGGFAFSPVVEILFQTYGFQGAFLLIGGFSMHIFIAACLFRPIELHRKLTSRKSFLKRSSKDQTELVVLQSVENMETEDNLGTSMTSFTNEKSGHNSHSRQKQEQQNENEINEHNQALLENTPDDDIALNSNAESNTSKKEKKTAKKNRWIDFSILKDVRYVCYVFATICFTLPTSGLFLPSLAVSRGVSEIQAASLLSVSAGFDTVFRILSGFVLDLKWFRNIRPEIFNAISFLQCLTIALFPSMRTFGDFVVLCAFQGALVGTKNAQGSVIVMDMLGVDKLASSMVITMSAQGMSVFLGPTISGQLTDIYGTYDGAFYFGAGATFIGAVVMAFGQVRKRYKDRVKSKTNRDVNHSSEIN